MSNFIYTDLINGLLDPRFVNPESTLIHACAYHIDALSTPPGLE